MGRENKKIRISLVVFGDILIIFSSYVASYTLRFGTLSGVSDYFPPVLFILLVAAYLVVFYFLDLYSFPLRSGPISLFFQIVLATAIASLIVLATKYILFLFPIGRGILVLANLLIIILVYGWRNLSRAAFRLFLKPQAVLVIGTGAPALSIGRIIAEHEPEYDFLGYLAGGREGDQTGETALDDKVLGAPPDLARIIDRHGVNLIILSEASVQNEQLNRRLLDAQLKAVEIVGIVEMYERLTGRIPIGHIEGEDWFIKTKGFSFANNHIVNRLKRSMDLVIATTALIVSLPLWPIIALLIRIDSKGAVFYRQTRIGKKESVFWLLKFRSMIEGAEEHEPLWARKDDQRITKVGRFLRKLHLDELPQLWNILRGDMSLVGPRPERPEFVETLKKEIPYYALRHSVKPGLTGWAQINYPYAASSEDSRQKLEYDLYYISHMSFLLDLRILARTGKGLLFGSPKKRAA